MPIGQVQNWKKTPKTIRAESRTISNHPVTALRTVFRFVSSLKTAIPLLVVTIAVTVAGSLFPKPDLFRTWWYLGLLGLNGLSLLFVTIQHIPLILERKGRNALIGVVVTHMGILILIAGMIYGGLSGFRYEVRAIEGEMTIVPGLPFVIRLDKLAIEEYPQDAVARMASGNTLKKTQDSYLSLLKNGDHWIDFVTRPGMPAKVEGITILPSLNDTGWYFELIITDRMGREKTIPVRPWAPPIIRIGDTPLMAHSLMETGELSARLFTKSDGKMVPLGVVSRTQTLEIDGSTISIGSVKRYTGLFIYKRPQAPILVVGCLAMLFGLLWHFYHRHRDRSRATRGDGQYV